MPYQWEICPKIWSKIEEVWNKEKLILTRGKVKAAVLEALLEERNTGR